jgi:type IV pilus assembly protein PilM
MVSFLSQHRVGPIGVDISPRSVKLVQFDADHGKVLDAVRWDVGGVEPPDKPTAAHDARIAEALKRAREGRRFRGRDCVLCLDCHDLLVANVRIAKQPNVDIDRLVQQEAAGRVPFAIQETEIRYLEGADVRQGDSTVRELTLLACHRPAIERKIALAESAGMRPIAIDVAPTALLRSYVSQYRRDDDRRRRVMYVHIGASSTFVVIAQGGDVLLAKLLGVGGRNFDEAVSRNLSMSIGDAVTLRRNHGDRRADQQDPEIARSVAESTRPVVEQLTTELAKCVRYHSVTFRGQPLSAVVLGGGEANTALADLLTSRLDVKCELGDPLRTMETQLPAAHRGQWDVAAGLALRPSSVKAKK